nr:acetamidase/formamidase family protein [Actinomyces haliotis]
MPTVHAAPTARVRSGRTILIDALSHEGLLEDQGRDPISWFGEHGVRRHHVLADAIDVAARYDRHRRDFDADGPHVVTGPVFVEGAEPGDVLKIETLDLRTRVPYGVVSSRHGKGTLAITPNGTPPAGISLAEVMPPHATDGRATHDPTGYGNVSVFADIVDGRARMRAGRRHVHFPLQLFFGMMGVARSEATTLNDPSAHSVPTHPSVAATSTSATSGWTAPSTCPWRPRAPCSTSATRTTRWARARALTAMEGSLRGTFRLSVCKKGSGDAPSVAFHHPFGETRDAWIPIGLSDPDGLVGGDDTDLNVGRCAGRSSMRSTTCRSTWASPALSPTPTSRRPATSTSASSSTRPPACTA